MTRKARFINNIESLSQDEKKKLLDFFNKHSVYESLIDWNRKNLRYQDFLKVFEKADGSANRARKNAKTNPETLFKNHNCKIISSTDQFIIAIPLDWQCAVFFNSFSCGGEGARWCIGDKKSSRHWDLYTESEDVFFFIFFKQRHPRFGKKIIVQYQPENNNKLLLYTQNDEIFLEGDDVSDLLVNYIYRRKPKKILKNDFNTLMVMVTEIKKAMSSLNAGEFKPKCTEYFMENLFSILDIYLDKVIKYIPFTYRDFIDFLEKSAIIYERGSDDDRTRVNDKIGKLEDAVRQQKRNASGNLPGESRQTTVV